MTIQAPPDLPDADERAERLRAPLLLELQRQPVVPRDRRRLVAAAVAAVTLVAAALSVGAFTREPAPALAVERENGWIVLRIADVAAGEDALTRELREAGIDGEVRLLPVPPANVGSWAVISERAGRPGAGRVAPEADASRETVRLDRVEYRRETLRIPIAEVRESTGYFVFYAGREAQPGEELWRDGDRVFRP
jgi:hypothetical protein